MKTLNATILTLVLATSSAASAAGVVEDCYCDHYGSDPSIDYNGCIVDPADAKKWSCDISSIYTAQAPECSVAAGLAYSQAAVAARSDCAAIFTLYETFRWVRPGGLGGGDGSCRVNAQYICAEPEAATAKASLPLYKVSLSAEHKPVFEERREGECSRRTKRKLDAALKSRMVKMANAACPGASDRMNFKAQASRYFTQNSFCVAISTFTAGCTPGSIGNYDWSAAYILSPPPEVSKGQDLMGCLPIQGKWECFVEAPGSSQRLFDADLVRINAAADVERVRTVQQSIGLN